MFINVIQRKLIEIMQENSVDKNIYFCTKESNFINVYKQTYFQIDIDSTEFQFEDVPHFITPYRLYR